ncbi:MAG: hypothetical protein KGL77_03595 [Actinomycetales bacterium]|nr:hypothetical protein [Actinomycetales bacterium]
MSRNEKLFAIVTGAIALVVQLIDGIIWSLWNLSTRGDEFYASSPPPWFDTVSGLLGSFLLVLTIWVFSKATLRRTMPVAITAGVSSLIGLAIQACMMVIANGFVFYLTQIFWPLALGALGGLAIRRLRNSRLANVIYIMALGSGVILQLFGSDGDTSPYPWMLIIGVICKLLVAVATFELLSRLRIRLLLASSVRLARRNLPIQLQKKSFFAAKGLATGAVFSVAAVFAFVLFELQTFLAAAIDLWNINSGYLPTVAVACGTVASAAVFVVWIPALIANRALAKGKSWDAFFWLSIFVSPLLMWIIAEASTDTRGMVYGAASQAPVQAYAHAAPAAYAPAAVPAAPVTASDTRECPECAETIKKAAKLCKHCGSKVTPIA